MPLIVLLLLISAIQGCSSVESAFGVRHIETGPEFKQEIILQVGEDFRQHQAARSSYDVGDLQSFHTQHTLPIVIEDAFKDLFGKVTVKDAAALANLEVNPPKVPAIFEVRIMDLAHDIYSDAQNYRAQIVIGVAMKSPRGKILWQQSFRGDGYTRADPSFSTQMGPENAILDALRSALEQMQTAMAASSIIKNHMAHYAASNQARQATEVQS